MSRSVNPWAVQACLLAGLLLPLGCDQLFKGEKGPGLARGTDQPEAGEALRSSGFKLGALGNATPIRARADRESPRLGYLRAGAQIERSAEPVGRLGCPGGWYGVRPRGFVCAGELATTELSHPTLKVMSESPQLNQPLPFSYARVRVTTELFARDPKQEDSVHEIGQMRRQSTFAVVGSWQALDEEDQRARLALLTSGQFVRIESLVPVKVTPGPGVELAGLELPLAFVTHSDAKSYRLGDDGFAPVAPLGERSLLGLSGRQKLVDSERYLATRDELWVRERDVSAVRRRNDFGSFVKGSLHWADLDLTTGALVLYAGETPVFATVALSLPDKRPELGPHLLTCKHITNQELTPSQVSGQREIHDLAWTLELEGGLLVHAAWWMDGLARHGEGNRVALAPSDAKRAFDWLGPAVPQGWHALELTRDERSALIALH